MKINIKKTAVAATATVVVGAVIYTLVRNDFKFKAGVAYPDIDPEFLWKAYLIMNKNALMGGYTNIAINTTVAWTAAYLKEVEKLTTK